MFLSVSNVSGHHLWRFLPRNVGVDKIVHLVVEIHPSRRPSILEVLLTFQKPVASRSLSVLAIYKALRAPN